MSLVNNDNDDRKDGIVNIVSNYLLCVSLICTWIIIWIAHIYKLSIWLLYMYTITSCLLLFLTTICLFYFSINLYILDCLNSMYLNYSCLIICLYHSSDLYCTYCIVHSENDKYAFSFCSSFPTIIIIKIDERERIWFHSIGVIF